MGSGLCINDFNRVCRLCLSFEDLKPIVEVKHLDVITSLTSIEIKEGDRLPENICNSCTGQLRNIFNFLETCKSSAATLKAVISHRELQEEDQHVRIYDSELSDRDDDSRSDSSRKSTSIRANEDTDIVCNSAASSGYNKQIRCVNCQVKFSSSESLHQHYEAFIDCMPKDHKSHKLLRKDIEHFFEVVEEEKIKVEIYNEEKEYARGKMIKGKRKFLCNYCGKNYTRKNGLDRHIMSHTGVKPFECKECGKRYITKDTLKTHILIHTGIKTHKCEVCQKSFIQSSHLNYHMRRHAGEKPHTCSFCGKGFLSSYHLERHKLMHTGVKPFKCDLCDKQFVRSTTLRDHLLLHTGERPFQCQHCGKQFNRKQTLTNHVNLVHWEEGTNDIFNNYSTDLFIEENVPKLECI